MQDFGYYEIALRRIGEGFSPYEMTKIGKDYLYPPPALFVVELFSSIEPVLLKAIIYCTVNIVLWLGIIYGVLKQYGYTIYQTWYCYVLALCFAPFWELIQVGQINVVTLFGIFLAFIWGEKHPLLGGAGLTLAIITKVSPLVFFVYFLINKQWKLVVASITFLLGATGFGVLRYGIGPLIQYPTVLIWISNQFPLTANSQSLIAKIFWLQSTLLARLHIQIPFLTYAGNYPMLQYSFMCYFAALIGISALIFSVTKSNKELVFAIIGLSMALSPHIMWYHHYIFISLPLLVWSAASRFDTRVIGWCLFGLLIIQIDRWLPPYGLFIHIFGHVSILALLFQQLKLANRGSHEILNRVSARSRALE